MPTRNGRRGWTASSSLLLLATAGCTPETGPGKPAPAAQPGGRRAIGSVERLAPELDALVPPGAVIEVLAEGFEWAEGPLWLPDREVLLFSDPPANRIYRWSEGQGHAPWLEPSGYTGETPRGGEPGSNGLLLDRDGKLVLCQHGDRRIARLEAPLDAPRPTYSTVADRFDGKRFNSPNDVTQHSSGALYFTDPPYGLAGGPEDPARELAFSGVYRIGTDGEVSLVTDELSRPNGIAFSPDERTLYVSNSDPDHAVWMAYPVEDDGTVGEGEVFFDATRWVPERPGLPDGLEVDAAGNLFATGPGGVLVLSPDGRHLGTLLTGQPTSNCAFDRDGRALYMTADGHLLRVRLADRARPR